MWQKCDDAFRSALDRDAAWKDRGRGGVFHGQDLLKMSGEDIRHVRGAQITMVFQDPMTSSIR